VVPFFLQRTKLTYRNLFPFFFDLYSLSSKNSVFVGESQIPSYISFLAHPLSSPLPTLHTLFPVVKGLTERAREKEGKLKKDKKRYIFFTIDCINTIKKGKYKINAYIFNHPFSNLSFLGLHNTIFY